MKVYLVIDNSVNCNSNSIEKVFTSFSKAFNYITTLNKIDTEYYVIKEVEVEDLEDEI